jgi:hypothetical protein
MKKHLLFSCVLACALGACSKDDVPVNLPEELVPTPETSYLYALKAYADPQKQVVAAEDTINSIEEFALQFVNPIDEKYLQPVTDIPLFKNGSAYKDSLSISGDAAANGLCIDSVSAYDNKGRYVSEFTYRMNPSWIGDCGELTYFVYLDNDLQITGKYSTTRTMIKNDVAITMPGRAYYTYNLSLKKGWNIIYAHSQFYFDSGVMNDSFLLSTDAPLDLPSDYLIWFDMNSWR